MGKVVIEEVELFKEIVTELNNKVIVLIRKQLGLVLIKIE